MYFSAPIHVQRQYASNDGLYKIHAITKTQPSRQLGSGALYDMLTQFVQPAASGRPGSIQNRQRSDQQEVSPQTSQSLRAGKSLAVQNPDMKFVPNPLDRSAGSKPYNPSGRFREPGYHANYLPTQPLTSDKQQSHSARQTEMQRAYKPFATLELQRRR